MLLIQESGYEQINSLFKISFLLFVCKMRFFSSCLLFIRKMNVFLPFEFLVSQFGLKKNKNKRENKEMKRCFYCYQLLEPGQIDFHPSCSKKIFGTPIPSIFLLDGQKSVKSAVGFVSVKYKLL